MNLCAHQRDVLTWPHSIMEAVYNYKNRTGNLRIEGERATARRCPWENDIFCQKWHSVGEEMNRHGFIEVWRGVKNIYNVVGIGRGSGGSKPRSLEVGTTETLPVDRSTRKKRRSVHANMPLRGRLWSKASSRSRACGGGLQSSHPELPSHFEIMLEQRNQRGAAQVHEWIEVIQQPWNVQDWEPRRRTPGLCCSLACRSKAFLRNQLVRRSVLNNASTTNRQED